MVGKDERGWPWGSVSLHNKLLVLGDTLMAPAEKKRNQCEGFVECYSGYEYTPK